MDRTATQSRHAADLAAIKTYQESPWFTEEVMPKVIQPLIAGTLTDAEFAAWVAGENDLAIVALWTSMPMAGASGKLELIKRIHPIVVNRVLRFFSHMR